MMSYIQNRSNQKGDIGIVVDAFIETVGDNP